MDIVDAPTSEVWGVVYKIDELDIGRLDRKEGYRPGRPKEQNSYERIERMVYEDADPKRPLSVWTYKVANPLEKPVPPSQEYKGFFVDGAKHWHLPKEYIERLEAVVAKEPAKGS